LVLLGGCAAEQQGSILVSRLRLSGTSTVYLDGRPARSKAAASGREVRQRVVLSDPRAGGSLAARIDNVPLDGRQHLAVVVDRGGPGGEQRLWCWVRADPQRIANYLDVDLWQSVPAGRVRWVLLLTTVWVAGMIFIFGDSAVEGQGLLWAMTRGTLLGVLGPLGVALYVVSVRRLLS
jgi:hypothetical protein